MFDNSYNTTSQLGCQITDDFLPLTLEDLEAGLTDEQFAWLAARMNIAVVATEADAERSDAA